MNAYEVVRRPVITEKSTMLGEQSKYIFEVARTANKIDIKKSVEEVFKVHVLAVNIIHVAGKMRRLGRSQGRSPAWKKAIVTLQSGDRIELFEGV